MEVVAEVVLSTTLELLLEKLASSDSWKYVVGGRARSELKKWKSELVEIGEVLKDAEDKQIRKESVRKWLGQLRDLAYDMEDVLDEFGYHDQIMRRNLMMGEEADGNIHGEGGSSTSQVCRFFSVPSCCTPFTPVRNLKMGSKIQAITGRLEQISSERNKYGLDKAAAVTQSSPWKRPPNTSLVNESEVYGRDVDKKRIIDMLLRLHKEDDDPHPSAADQYSSTIYNVFSVVSIVAMGGMGKTTLARLVYEDAEATKDFTAKGWACVSDQFDDERVTRAILNSFGVSYHSQSDFNELQEKLRDGLKGKKFLLVLDDVWTDDPNDWYCLRAPFSSAARGSKIIVTTRDKRVAEVMGSGDHNLHQLQPLSEEECWSVFKRHSNIDVQSTFASTGKQIVKKCDGLPLAARALGCLLLNEQRQEKWEAVLTSPIWELKESSIIPALRLSYNYLPPHLKRCFAYCALFPKDFGFNKEELIRLWMAEGFFEQSNHQVKQQLEDLGDDYFLELVSKSFFQLSASNTSTFVMHDLIHDLAKFVSKETCLHLDDQSENDPPLSISNSIRHLSYAPHMYDPYRRFEKFHKQSQLRTYMNIWLEEPWYQHYISRKVLEELIPQFKCLRVLSLRNYKITEIPNSFGDQLKHLRYLDLSKTHIQWLPDSIGNLFYLQTLKLSECEQLSKLPISIKNLMNLRHLDISGENKLEEVPSDIHKLKNLRLLSNFIVGEDNGLSNLGGMTNLGGDLCISKLEEVVDIQDAGLISQQKLTSLIVKWSAKLDGYLGTERNHLDVLRSLQPRTALEQLRIEGYGGWEFPNWVGDASFSQMVDLTLKNCGNCTSLPCLGQLPSLKRLSITGMSGVKKVGAEFYGANNRSFPSLEYLHFENMRGWEEWEDSNICLGTSKNSSFSCLQELRMRDCPNLKKLYITNCRGITNMEEEIMMRGGVDDHLIMTTSLMKLEIRNIPTRAKLDAGFVRGLLYLWISDCEGFTCLWDDDDGGDGLGSENLHKSLDDDQMIREYCPERRLGCNLRYLSISDCGRLERLPNGWHKTLTCLEDLHVSDCPNLESFPEVGFPPKLRSIHLACCDRLKCLPNGMMMSKMRENSDINGSNNSCVVLESLYITGCPSLINLEGGGVQLPTSLKTLHIGHCCNLESLPAGVVCAGLEDLAVNSCPSLNGFPNNNNNTSCSTSPSSTLKELSISKCENLKSLPEGIFMTEHDHGDGGPVLQVLQIDYCPSLQSFPERGMFPSTLEKLEIGGCGQLESISEEMFLHCSSSSSSSQLFLSLSDYPNLKALPDHHGLSGALSEIRITSCKNLDLRPEQFQHFTHLTSLEIRDCENIKTPLSQWGLTRLPSLKSLSIGGIFLDATSFSDHQQSSNTSLLLPTSLTALCLLAFPYLESIASLSLHELHSLEILHIHYCPKLQSILPRKKRLPPTLLYLAIETAPLLEKRYSKEKGKDWSKIAHIPRVDIGDHQPFISSYMTYLLRHGCTL